MMGGERLALEWEAPLAQLWALPNSLVCLTLSLTCIKSWCWTGVVRFSGLHCRWSVYSKQIQESRAWSLALLTCLHCGPPESKALRLCVCSQWPVVMPPPAFHVGTGGLCNNNSMCRCLCLLERVTGTPRRQGLAEPMSCRWHLLSPWVWGDSGNQVQSAWSSVSAPRSVA